MRALAIGLLTASLLSTQRAAAAPCAPLTLPEQVAAADAILEGRVLGAREPGFYEVAVLRALKGGVSGTIAVRASAARGANSGLDLGLRREVIYTLYVTRDLDAFTTHPCAGGHEGTATADEIASVEGRSGADGTGDANAPLQGPAAAALLAGLLVALLAIRRIARSRPGLRTSR